LTALFLVETADGNLWAKMFLLNHYIRRST